MLQHDERRRFHLIAPILPQNGVSVASARQFLKRGFYFARFFIEFTPHSSEFDVQGGRSEFPSTYDRPTQAIFQPTRAITRRFIYGVYD